MNAVFLSPCTTYAPETVAPALDALLEQVGLRAQVKPGMRVGILVGPEGGFDPKEVELAMQAGARVVSLGKRILRAETAAVTAVAMGMLHVELSEVQG